jgi:hypothetical protein
MAEMKKISDRKFVELNLPTEAAEKIGGKNCWTSWGSAGGPGAIHGTSEKTSTTVDQEMYWRRLITD